MSLNKSIKYGKEKRQEFRGAKLCDRSCRNHGSCDYCKSNRTAKNKRRIDKADYDEKDYGE